MVVEGLDAQPVAGGKEPVPSCVPERKGKHSAQPLHTITSVFLVEVDDGFRVAPAAIAVPAGFQVWPQLLVIINLAVVNQPDCSIFVRERLLAGLEVDDAQPAHRQAHILGKMETSFIRAPVYDLPVHGLERGAPDLMLGIEIYRATDSAHRKVQEFRSQKSGLTKDASPKWISAESSEQKIWLPEPSVTRSKCSARDLRATTGCPPV